MKSSMKRSLAALGDCISGFENEGRAAAARQESFEEILETIYRLTEEWNASDRIDMIVRMAASREAL